MINVPKQIKFDFLAVIMRLIPLGFVIYLRLINKFTEEYFLVVFLMIIGGWILVYGFSEMFSNYKNEIKLENLRNEIEVLELKIKKPSLNQKLL